MTPRCFQGILVFWLIVFPLSGSPLAEPADRADKQAIITLIEDRLSGAFSVGSPKERPCFGTLDELYPEWHGGNPVEERRRWTFHGYEEYRVTYRVYTVHIHQPGLATVKGVKRIKLYRRVTFSIFPPELKKEMTEAPFAMSCRRKPTGEWEIIKEIIE